MKKRDPLVWIDLEMTGLDPEKDLILEIALMITDGELNIMHAGPSLVIHYDAVDLPQMSPWVMNHHSKTGLFEAVKNSTIGLAQAEQQVLEAITQYCTPKKSPLCGNSVWADANFMRKHMPKIMDFLHYRIVDVSSIKEVVDRWYPNHPKRAFIKKDTHRALSDIEESIAELKHYRSNFFI